MNKEVLRVLHIVGGLDRGGIETFLMHVLKRRDAARLPMDFIVHQEGPNAYDEQVLSSGSRLFRCPFTTQPRKYAGEFKRIVKENGPFDVAHAHVHHYNGFILKLAHETGIPIRITHSHNDTSHVDAQAGFARKIYLAQMDRMMRKHATLGLACSQLAANSLFGENWQSDPRWKLLPYGIEMSAFRQSLSEYSDRSAMRQKLGIADDALFVIHVGRFDPQKNHPFLIRIAKALAEREPKFRLLMLGKGTMQEQIEKQVVELNLQDNVIFGGSRPDVPHCLHAADVFLMPSFHEGLPLAGLEAQAAGLPSVVSDTVTPELAVAPGLVRFVSLEQSPEVWADEVLKARSETSLPRERALATMESSVFNIENSVRALESIYHDAASNLSSRA